MGSNGVFFDSSLPAAAVNVGVRFKADGLDRFDNVMGWSTFSGREFSERGEAGMVIFCAAVDLVSRL